MATVNADQSIFVSILRDGDKNIDEMILKIREDLREEDKNDIKYLTAVCFKEQELESLDGFRDCLCDILHRLPVSFLAKGSLK